MSYNTKMILNGNRGNNAFAWKKREELYWAPPTLIIPNIIEWTLTDILIGDDIVFEEEEGGKIISCKGLKNFVQITIPQVKDPSQYPAIKLVTIFDNHNHALYFWIDALRKWIIEKWCELIHIDEHSDLWWNNHTLNLENAIVDEQYAWEFTNYDCNVGNYIIPAIESGLISHMIRIENEFQIDDYMNYKPKKNSILNIDLDIFSSELEYIPTEKTIMLIKNLLAQVNYVTIATSPYFIDPWRAIEKLNELFKYE